MAAKRGGQVNELASQVESLKATLGSVSQKASDSQALTSLTAQLSERDSKIAVSSQRRRGSNSRPKRPRTRLVSYQPPIPNTCCPLPRAILSCCRQRSRSASNSQRVRATLYHPTHSPTQPKHMSPPPCTLPPPPPAGHPSAAVISPAGQPNIGGAAGLTATTAGSSSGSSSKRGGQCARVSGSGESFGRG